MTRRKHPQFLNELQNAEKELFRTRCALEGLVTKFGKDTVDQELQKEMGKTYDAIAKEVTKLNIEVSETITKYW